MTAADKIFELWYQSLSTTMTLEEARAVFDRTIKNANHTIQQLISISNPRMVRTFNSKDNK